MTISITVGLSENDAEEIRALGRYLLGYKQRSGTAAGLEDDTVRAFLTDMKGAENAAAVDAAQAQATADAAIHDRPRISHFVISNPAVGYVDPPHGIAPARVDDKLPDPPPDLPEQTSLLDSAPPPPSGWHVDPDSGALLLDAPAPPPPPPPPAEAAVLRDVNGTVWDPAIHAASKTFVKDGTWRLRRGSGGGSGTTETPPPPPPPADPAVVLRNRIVAALTDGSLTATVSAAAQNRVGLTGGLPALHNRPDLVPALYAALGWEP